MLVANFLWTDSVALKHSVLLVHRKKMKTLKLKVSPQDYLNCTMRKYVSGHMLTVKTQISLDICVV